MPRLYSSQEILAAEDLYQLQDTFCSSAIPFKYQMTEEELRWLNFVKGRYSSADWIQENLDNEGVLTFDCPFAMNEALSSEGINGFAPMLSNDTALQRLFFWLYDEIED